MGTWIEIIFGYKNNSQNTVVPFVGTWIEITYGWTTTKQDIVVPFVGTWIEMLMTNTEMACPMSFPSWERGLKFVEYYKQLDAYSRSLRGNVD